MEKPKLTGRQLIFEHQLNENEIADAKSEWNAYIDDKYKVGYSEENTCYINRLNDGTVQFQGFGITASTKSFYGKFSGDIKKCRITIVEDHVNLHDYMNRHLTEYFGWVSYKSDDNLINGIEMIQPCAEMFAMQFPAGPYRKAAAGGGKTVRLKIEII